MEKAHFWDSTLPRSPDLGRGRAIKTLYKTQRYSKNPKKKTFVRGPKPLKRKTFDVLSQIDHFRKPLLKKTLTLEEKTSGPNGTIWHLLGPGSQAGPGSRTLIGKKPSKTLIKKTFRGPKPLKKKLSGSGPWALNCPKPLLKNFNP